MNANALPRTIPEYLEQLRAALKGADPALVQDALYDAEDYLRAELAEQQGKSEAEVIASVAGSYGAPEEVAEIYRDTEVKVARALRPPPPPPHPSLLGKFFGVAADPRTYGALFYMMLALATGIFYFTWVVAGASVSAGLLVLIVGVPLLLLFLLSVRLLSLVEGRIVEVLLGERMPRRPLYTQRDKGWLQRLKELFTDVRTWTTMLYFLLMLPLGTAYFSVAVTLLSTALACILSPLSLLDNHLFGFWYNGDNLLSTLPVLPILTPLFGIVLLFATLHLARAIGRFHGWLAKNLLVRDPVL